MPLAFRADVTTGLISMTVIVTSATNALSISEAAVAAEANLGPQPNLLGYRYIYRNIFIPVFL